MGLSDLKRQRSLYKEAMESDMKRDISNLISQQAYEDLTSRFQELRPLILGINIVEKIDKDTILAAAKLAIPDKNIIIPIVYSGGVVDATTFIYNEDTDILLGLTKKIVNIITIDSSSISGVAVGRRSSSKVDRGSIDKLFTPPRTFSPKVAASGLLIQMMESSDLLKQAVYNKMRDDYNFGERLVSIYGEEIAYLAKEGMDNRLAEELDKDYADNEVLWSSRSIFDSNWMNKEAAIKEYYLNGFAISQGKDTPTKSLEKVETVQSKILGGSNSEELESFSTNRRGAFYLYSENGEKYEVFSGQNISRFNDDGGDINSVVTNANARIHPDRFYVSTKMKISESKMLHRFTLDRFDDCSKQDIAYKDKKRNSIVILDGDDVFATLNLGVMSGCNISETLKSYVISESFYSGKIVIEKKSSSKPIRLDNAIYVGENNVKLIIGNPKSEEVTFLEMSELSKTANSRELVNIDYDGVNFLYKKSSYGEVGLVNELLNDGFDKHSVYDIVKTAQDDGKASMAAVNAKIDMLTNMVMNLAGSVKSGVNNNGSLSSLANGGQQEPLAGGDTGDAPAQDVAGGAPVQDATGGTPDNVPPEENGAMTASPNAGASDPTQGMATDTAQEPKDSQGGNGAEDNKLVDGMNPSVDADMLNTLKDIKNSSVMDMGVLSAVASSADMSSVIKEYRGDIQSGVSAIARILLNMMTKKNIVEENIGTAKYKQFISTVRPLLAKMSDMYADIYFLKIESDVGN